LLDLARDSTKAAEAVVWSHLRLQAALLQCWRNVAVVGLATAKDQEPPSADNVIMRLSQKCEEFAKLAKSGTSQAVTAAMCLIGLLQVQITMLPCSNTERYPF
jgi:hypothetical protein